MRQVMAILALGLGATALERVADAGAWAGVAEDASSLLKMEDTLRRQLENKRDWVFSYDFSEPTAKPTSSPTFTPCDVEGEYRYYLALYDYGGDGWEGATYTLYKYVGVRQGEQILTGTVETGSEEVINFCLPNGLLAVDGIVMPPTEPPTASNFGQPTAFDA